MKKTIIEIKEEVQIGDIILEVGDKIKVLELKEEEEFENSFKISVEDVEKISKNYGVPWEKHLDKWILFNMGEQVMIYFPKKERLFTDFDLKILKKLIDDYKK